ncbi:MAG TPA: hypothetical protein VGV87_15110 [Blastocatellia bacterium]|nr:hypothetical protein [Blastocatellia bacterium]
MGWCEERGHQVQMVGTDEAAILCRVSSRAIYRMIEANTCHFKESTDGLLLLCASLLEIGGKRNERRLASRRWMKTKAVTTPRCCCPDLVR